MRVGGKIPDHQTALRKLVGLFDEWDRVLERSKPSFGTATQMRPFPQYRLRPKPLVRTTLTTANRSIPALRLRSTALLMVACSVQDVSVPLGPPDNCKNQQWELEARVQGTTYDEGSATAFGLCFSGWTDCNGVSSDGGVKPSSKFISQPQSAPNNLAFTWQLSKWQIDLSDCSCDDPDPNGVSKNIFVTPINTAIFTVPAPGCNLQ